MVAEVITSIETRKLDRTFTYKIPEGMEEGIKIGSCILVPFGRGNKQIKAYVVNILKEAEDPEIQLKEIGSLESGVTGIDPRMLEFAARMQEYYYLPLASILKLMVLEKGSYRESYAFQALTLSSSGMEGLERMRRSRKKELLERLAAEGALPVEGLLRAGIARETIREVLKAGLAELEHYLPDHAGITLSKRQEELFGEIRESLVERRSETFLLFGATGSGKTELYFKAIEETLRQGRQAIVLLPEINLTEQMLARYERTFPGNVVVWHSQISPGEKRKNWDLLNSRERNILIGPRSAIFTNMREVGLVIVDEEHDTSYYQQNLPVYNGRDVALMRAEVEGAVAILGSATPAVDSMEKAIRGEYRLLRLEEKFYGQENPEVRLVDMARELKDGNFSIISRELKEEISSTLKRGEKVLLFLNRRGFYNFLMCRSCGRVIKCGSCEIPMTYHERENKLVCHYCGDMAAKPDLCPHCGSKRIRGIGIGTEQVVEVIRELFPGVGVGRLDSDIGGGRMEKQRILEEFKEAGMGILIGTQIIAKGIDFPNVGLVGILLGDMSLNFPDYRSREWTFQLLMQVIGRTSRREKKGRVLLQTYRPDDSLYSEIRCFNFDGFYETELAFRNRLGYPPYGEILRLQFSGADREVLTRTIWEIHEQLSLIFFEQELYKPKPNRIERHKGSFRWQILLKLTKDRLLEKEGELKKLFRRFYEVEKNGVLFYIERNPNGML